MDHGGKAGQLGSCDTGDCEDDAQFNQKHCLGI